MSGKVESGSYSGLSRAYDRYILPGATQALNLRIGYLLEKTFLSHNDMGSVSTQISAQRYLTSAALGMPYLAQQVTIDLIASLSVWNQLAGQRVHVLHQEENKTAFDLALRSVFESLELSIGVGSILLSGIAGEDRQSPINTLAKELPSLLEEVTVTTLPSHDAELVRLSAASQADWTIERRISWLQSMAPGLDFVSTHNLVLSDIANDIAEYRPSRRNSIDEGLTKFAAPNPTHRNWRHASYLAIGLITILGDLASVWSPAADRAITAIQTASSVVVGIAEYILGAVDLRVNHGAHVDAKTPSKTGLYSLPIDLPPIDGFSPSIIKHVLEDHFFVTHGGTLHARPELIISCMTEQICGVFDPTLWIGGECLAVQLYRSIEKCLKGYALAEFCLLVDMSSLERDCAMNPQNYST